MWTVDQIPAERLVRPLVVLNVRSKVSEHPDYEISVQDIADWESQNGEIPSGAVVMAYTGWEDRWNTPKSFRNAAPTASRTFPDILSKPRQFLVKTRDAVGLGIDTMSIDPGASKTYPGAPVHRQRERLPVGERSQPRIGSGLRRNDRGCSDQAGRWFGRPGAVAGAGEVKL